MVDKNGFLRAGGVVLPMRENQLSGGKNPDGSYWVEMRDRHAHMRATLNPQQALDFATGLLRLMGYQLERQAIVPE